MRRLLGVLLIFAAAAAAGCSPAPAPVSQAQNDPSNPRAAEGTTPAVADAAKDNQEHHQHAAAGYVCPMHPEVTSDKPGTCPKCNMHLVPKK